MTMVISKSLEYFGWPIGLIVARLKEYRGSQRAPGCECAVRLRPGGALELLAPDGPYDSVHGFVMNPTFRKVPLVGIDLSS